MVEYTPHVGIPLLLESQGTPRVRHNNAMVRVDFHAAPNILKSLTTPPVQPAEGDAYWVIATATGAWAGKEGMIAIYINSAWDFITPYTGMQAVFQQNEATTPQPEHRWYYDGTELWVPSVPRWTDADSNVAAEHFTGKLNDGAKRYAQSVDFGALPNNTTKNVAHSISGLVVTKGSTKSVHYEIMTSDGTFNVSHSETYTVVSSTMNAIWSIDATNLSCITNADFSAWDAIIRLEYCKT